MRRGGSRTISYQGYDPVGRERSRTEVTDGATSTTTTSVYDVLGRLSSSVQTAGTTFVSNQQYSYDPLGNILNLSNTGGTQGASSTTLTYLDTDRDRICRIAYVAGSGTDCNVVYDGLGNIVSQPTRTGTRALTYFADGNVRTITDGATSAQFRYDAFGEVQELDVTSTTSPDTRHDRRYGALFTWRDEGTTSVLSRQIPGPGGLVATRHGPGGPWVFAFGEARGNRFFTDETGAFVQDVKYQPFGEATSTGAKPGSHQYSNLQWNGGDALAALGLSHLGARLYDPVIGRFLSRDPLLTPRTAATTNPYAFASNDPVNKSDPSGLEESPPGSGDPDPLDSDGNGVSFSHIGHVIGGALETVGNAIIDAPGNAWDFFFGGGHAAPKPIDPAPGRSLMRVTVVPIPVFAPDFEDLKSITVRGGNSVRNFSNDVGQRWRDGTPVITGTAPSIVGMALVAGCADAPIACAFLFADGLTVGDGGGATAMVSSTSLGPIGKGIYLDLLLKALEEEVEVSIESNGPQKSIRRIYEPNPKHGPEPSVDSRGRTVSRAPRGDCQSMLDCSVQRKATSPERLGVEPSTGSTVVFRRHLVQDLANEVLEFYHGFVP